MVVGNLALNNYTRLEMHFSQKLNSNTWTIFLNITLDKNMIEQ